MAEGPGEVAATSDQIRSQIEQTRGEMSDTIGAIQARLSPTRVLADATHSVTEATVGRVKRVTGASPGAMWRRLQDRPLPVALLATAAAGLLMRSLTNRRRRPSLRKIPITAPVRQPGATRVGRASDTISRERRSARRLLAAAGTGAACWGIWRAQTAIPRFGTAPR
jgi:Protein of unknown function (DUF3618)